MKATMTPAATARVTSSIVGAIVMPNVPRERKGLHDAILALLKDLKQVLTCPLVLHEGMKDARGLSRQVIEEDVPHLVQKCRSTAAGVIREILPGEPKAHSMVLAEYLDRCDRLWQLLVRERDTHARHLTRDDGKDAREVRAYLFVKRRGEGWMKLDLN